MGRKDKYGKGSKRSKHQDKTIISHIWFSSQPNLSFLLRYIKPKSQWTQTLHASSFKDDCYNCYVHEQLWYCLIKKNQKIFETLHLHVILFSKQDTKVKFIVEISNLSELGRQFCPQAVLSKIFTNMNPNPWRMVCKLTVIIVFKHNGLINKISVMRNYQSIFSTCQMVGSVLWPYRR